MRRSPLTVSLLGLVVVGLALTGCATGTTSAGDPTTAEPSVEPTPTPTIEPVALGPAEMPPLEFDGDCERALPAADLAQIVGFEVTLDPTGHRYLSNLGALECTWTGSDGPELRLYVVPRAAVDGPVFPVEEEDSFFDQCSYDGYTCAWQGGDESAWIAADFAAADVTQEEANAWGEAIAARVLENRAANPAVPWTRDRSGWWFALDCTQAATAVGAQSGQPLEGQFYGWDADRPTVGYAVSLTTAGQTQCFLADDEPGPWLGTLRVQPGEGARAVEEGYEPVELGVPGITAYARVSDSDGSGATYVITDSVNRVELSVGGDDAAAEQLAVAVAAAAASDFQ